jgi:hypothetical protein
MSATLAALVTSSLRTLLTESMFRADTRWSYFLNSGEPGFIDTLKSLSAEQASTPPGPDRKPIVSHANHVLYGWELINRALRGDDQAFAGADWSQAWKLEQVSDAEWAVLLQKLEQNANDMLAIAPDFAAWDEIMLTGMFGSVAHTAYHLGAIRQMLREI